MFELRRISDMWQKIFFLVLLCTSLSAPAQNTENVPELLSPESLAQHLGQNWRGILYVCNPFCEFISLREGKAWNPPVDKIPADWKHVKTVAKTDPLYPLLIMRDPVLPFVNPALADEPTVATPILEIPPQYASYPFAWGLALSGGVNLFESHFSGNSTLQENLSSQGVQYAPTFLVQAMRGKPSAIGKWWFQHEFDLQASLAPNYVSQNPSMHTENLQYSLAYQIWIPHPDFRWGLHLIYDHDEWDVGTNSLQEFSFTRQSYLGGLDFQWNHYMVVLDTSLMSTISEQQQFRQSPFTLQWYRLKVQKCSRDLTLFDITFGLCGGLSFVEDQQKAAFANNILLNEQSTLNHNDINTYFLIRIGEDLY